MVKTAVEVDPRLIALVLPGIPESVSIARFGIRAALGFHQLSEYAEDAVAVTSELVTNAIEHACADDTDTIIVILARTWNPEAVTVMVKDSSPDAPVKREPSCASEQGRGLLVVGELSAYWGWEHEDGGKSVYAVLAREAGA